MVQQESTRDSRGPSDVYHSFFTNNSFRNGLVILQLTHGIHGRNSC